METSIPVDIQRAKYWNFLMVKRFWAYWEQCCSTSLLSVCVLMFRRNNASFLLQCLSLPTLAEAHFSEVLINYMFQTLVYGIFFSYVFSSCPVVCRSHFDIVPPSFQGFICYFSSANNQKLRRLISSLPFLEMLCLFLAELEDKPMHYYLKILLAIC